jgi:hypothetical protein
MKSMSWREPFRRLGLALKLSPNSVSLKINKLFFTKNWKQSSTSFILKLLKPTLLKKSWTDSANRRRASRVK